MERQYRASVGRHSEAAMRERVCLMPLLVLALACGDDDAPEPEASEGSATTQAIGWLELEDPGVDPRRERRVAFTPGRSERATLTFDSVFDPAGHARIEERLELNLAIDYRSESEVLVRVVEARTTAGDIPAIATTVGTTARLVFDAVGAMEEPAVTDVPAAAPRAAGYVRGALMQVLPVLVPALPSSPIGPGARWGGEGLSFALLAADGDALRIERRTGLDRFEVLPDGTRIPVEEEQVYRLDARLDRVARAIEAELSTEGADGTRRRTELRFEVE